MQQFSITHTAFYLGYLAGENLKGRTRNRGSKLFEFPPCSTGLWSDLFELQPIDHTSPSWLPLLAPCHILAGLKNSLFLFELIRTKKDFLPETLGKAEGEECWHETAGLHFPKPFSRRSSPHSSLAGEPGLEVCGASLPSLLPVSVAQGGGRARREQGDWCFRGPGVGTCQRESCIVAGDHSHRKECKMQSVAWFEPALQNSPRCVCAFWERCHPDPSSPVVSWNV